MRCHGDQSKTVSVNKEWSAMLDAVERSREMSSDKSLTRPNHMEITGNFSGEVKALDCGGGIQIWAGFIVTGWCGKRDTFFKEV